jgi:hypothetical protein
VAAPVSLLALPIAHHLSRDSDTQGHVMLAAGAVTGFVSPMAVFMATALLYSNILAPKTPLVLWMSVVGALSGSLIVPVFRHLMSPGPKIPDEYWTS